MEVTTSRWPLAFPDIRIKNSDITISNPQKVKF